MRKIRPILLVEDDNVDAMTIKRAFSDLKITNEIIHKINGIEALEYLREKENKTPCLVLLDLNMPKMNGIDFLKEIRADEDLRKLAVVVLTTSGNEKDIVESFNLNIAGYIIKPVDYKKFVQSISAIYEYWALSEMPAHD